MDEIKKAISFLESIGTLTKDLSKVKYMVYDEDFSCYMNSDKELIDYANEQKQDKEDW